MREGEKHILGMLIRHLDGEWRLYHSSKVMCRSRDPQNGWPIWAPCNHGNELLRLIQTEGTVENKQARLLEP